MRAVNMKSDTVQLEFRCKECRASGLTPRMSPEKAMAVAHGDLQLRCPHCAAIIQITEPLASLMLERPFRRAVDTISTVLHSTFKDLRQRDAESEARLTELDGAVIPPEEAAVPRAKHAYSDAANLRP